MLNLRFILLCLLIPLFCIVFDSAYAEQEPKQVVDATENQPSVATTKAVAPTSAGAPTTILEILKLPTGFEQTAALYALLSKSGIAELKQLLLETKSIENSNDRRIGFDIIYGRFADLDPLQALSHLLSSNVGYSRQALSSMFVSWSKRNLTEAINQCRSLSNTNHQLIAINAILKAHQDKGLNELEQIAEQLGSLSGAALETIKLQKLTKLAQSNPQAAMEKVLETKNPSRRGGLLSMVALKWAAQDPIAALEYAEDMEPGPERIGFRRAVLAGIARQDPEGSLDLLDSGSVSRNERYTLLFTAMHELSQTDPQYALEKAQSLSRKQDRAMAVSAVLNRVASSDLETAIKMLDSMPDLSVVQSSAAQIMQKFAQSDPERALKWAESRSKEAPMLLQNVIRAIAVSNPEHAFELLAALPSSPAKIATFQSAVMAIAYRDPRLAASYLMKYPKGPIQQQVAPTIARAWFQDDPEAAIVWILSLDRQLQSQLLSQFASNVIEHDLLYAQSLLPLLPSAQVRHTWVSAIAKNMTVNNGPDAAVKWLQQYQDEPKYNDWINIVLGAVVSSGSIEYAIQLADNISDSDEYDKAVHAIVRVWSGKDIQAAADWVLRASETSNLDQLIQTVVAQWAAYDLKSAQQWVMRFKDSEQRDGGLSTLMKNQYISTQEADNILRKMMSSTHRFEALKTYLSNVAKYDSSAARLFLKRQIVLSDQKDTLMSVIENIENGID